MSVAVTRTSRERSGFVLCPRDEKGRVIAMDPLARFAAKCEFDPTTGCVLWTGGTTAGRGNTARYGSFWYGGRRWFAHRWAAVHIHGLNVSETQAGHCCPGRPNTLCVQHVQAQSGVENVAEQIARLGGVAVTQSPRDRQFWLLVQLGFDRLKEEVAANDGLAVPFFSPPAWLQPYMTGGA